MTHYAAIILAAGRGERSGREDGPKQYRLIGGIPVLRKTVEAFCSDPDCQSIVIVRHEDDEGVCAQSLGELLRRVEIVIGGTTRQKSTLNALSFLGEKSSGERPQFVMIHDAARPFLSPALLERIKGKLDASHGVIPALAIADTLKRGSETGLVTETVPRQGLFAAQTPQAFPFNEILRAHLLAETSQLADFTDDSSIAEWAGISVEMIEGSPDNVKLTWKRDIEMANERMLAASFPDVRTGNGYDVHSFVDGDHVWLGGVRIAHTHGLNGHSDSDVALHALTDALLATCAAGDIGTHFPPSDPQWKGCASSVFVKHAATLVRRQRRAHCECGCDTCVRIPAHWGTSAGND